MLVPIYFSLQCQHLVGREYGLWIDQDVPLFKVQVGIKKKDLIMVTYLLIEEPSSICIGHVIQTLPNQLFLICINMVFLLEN